MEIFETILHLTTPKTAEPASNVKIDSQRGAEEQTLEVRKAIVAGPRNSGRTSLLFEVREYGDYKISSVGMSFFKDEEN